MINVEVFAEVAIATSTLDDDAIGQGKRWYVDANRFCRNVAKRYGVSIRQVAGILAALSARTSWTDNKRKAVRYLAGDRAVHTGSNVAKCDRILTVDDDDAIMAILNGDKTRRFYHNIVHPLDSEYVTLDSWMTNLIGVEYGKLKVKGGYQETLYERYESVVQNVAASMHMRPLELQAALWVSDRGAAH